MKSFATQSFVPAKMFFLALLLVCACLLGGCLKNNARIRVQDRSIVHGHSYVVAKHDPVKDLSGVTSWLEKNDQERAYSVRQQEARLIDIPIPIHAVSLGCHEDQLTDTDKDSLVLAYRVYSKPLDIKSFFMIEMERLGWNMISHVEDVESLLVFVKPTKVCTISLRKYPYHDVSSLIVITYGNNKAGYSED